MTSDKTFSTPQAAEQGAQGAGPALGVEELAGLMLEVPCAQCGGMSFVVPYVAGVEHVVHCHKCGEQTRIRVGKSGGITYLPEKVAQARKRAS